MKNLVISLFVLFAMSSCTALKHSSATGSASSSTSAPSNSRHSDPKFINSISIKSGNSGSKAGMQEPELSTVGGGTAPPVSLEIFYPAQFKYAILLGVPVEEMLDHKLIDFLESWYGTRYRLGGTDKSGVDCSAFVQAFMLSLYGIAVPRTSRSQYENCEHISRTELQEGDLVFFNTQRRKEISHVGIYLRNNKFVHASTSSGVMISDLDETYYASHFSGAGRFILNAGAMNKSKTTR